MMRRRRRKRWMQNLKWSRCASPTDGPRTDLRYAQAQFCAAACDTTARRANHSKSVQPFAQKYSAFVLTQISGITPLVSPMEGRSRSSRTCGGMRWTPSVRQASAREAYGEVVWFGRRGAGVKSGRAKASSVATEAKEPFSGESTKQAVKPLRREGRDAPPVPVCSCAALFAQIARETAGAASTRSSLCPPTRRAGSRQQTSDAKRREIAKTRRRARFGLTPTAARGR
jgi:hypothetical protein